MKPLKPSLKEKKRYVVFEIISEKEISQDKIIEAVNRVCLDFMGILNFGKAGVLILRNQLNGNKGMIKVNNKFVDHLKASLMLLTEIDKSKVNVRVIGVSGIIKKAKEKFMKL